jgi:hypothetical protein
VVVIGHHATRPPAGLASARRRHPGVPDYLRWRTEGPARYHARRHGAAGLTVFNAGGGKITYEYDFGAGWIHEIALQKKVPREPCAAASPR